MLSLIHISQTDCRAAFTFSRLSISVYAVAHSGGDLRKIEHFNPSICSFWAVHSVSRSPRTSAALIVDGLAPNRAVT